MMELPLPYHLQKMRKRKLSSKRCDMFCKKNGHHLNECKEELPEYMEQKGH